MKNKKNISGSLGSSERGGEIQRRQSWPEKIALALNPIGTEKRALWFTHSGIEKRLQDQGQAVPDKLFQYLLILIKSGHIERAAKPLQMKAKYNQGPEYIYRRTAKPFKPAKRLKGIEIGEKIYRENPRLAKWFRDMMIYE